MKAAITIRPTAMEKQRVTELARIRGVSESTLALVALRRMLGAISDVGPDNEPDIAPVSAGPAIDRITIRLRPGDRQWLRSRAQARGMHDSAYLAALLRAHLSTNPPLPASEYNLLKMTISTFWASMTELSNLRRNLTRDGITTPQLQEQLADVSRRLEEIEQRFHEYMRAALKCWESRRG